MLQRRLRTTPASKRGAAPKTHEERATGFVTVSMREKGKKGAEIYHERHETELLRDTFDETDPPAYVRVGGGLTINLDNYESLRVDVSISIPCKRDRTEEAYEMASQFVADKVATEQANFLGEGGGIQPAKKSHKTR